MKVRKFLAVGCAVGCFQGSVQAAPPTTVNEAIAQITSDSNLLSGWISDQFKRAAPYNSAAGNVVPAQIKVFGFEVGAEAVVSATKMDNGALRTLPTQLVNTNEIDDFERMPFPMVLGHAKIGLPFGLDAGVRVGGIPTTKSDEGDTQMEIANKVFGLDLRKVLIEEGITRPFGLTLGLSYTHSKGHIVARSPYTPNVGSQVTLSDAFGGGRTDWQTDSYGLQAILNKKIAFINPYIGASVNKNTGDVDTSITNTGTVTAVNGTPVTPQGYTTIGTGHSKVNSWDLRALLGIEFSILPFVRLGVGGEVGTQNTLAGNIGLRVQFR